MTRRKEDTSKMRIKKGLFALLLVPVLLVLGLFIKTDYFLLLPSEATSLNTVIEVENAHRNKVGQFYLVTVSQVRASLTTALYGKLHPFADLNHARMVVPQGMDEKEYRQLLQENMTESQHMAEVVALRRAGFDVGINSEGVQVVHVVEEEAAEGYLFEDDIILAVDGKKVNFAPEVSLIVQERRVGETVELEVKRGENMLLLVIPTGANPEEADLPFLGIYIKTLPWEPVLPVKIKVETGNIGGPSAGLMFTLEIINQLTEDDLTKGYKIAGTGTIDLEEKVGRIGGITQKIVAAEKSGADYFILPTGNLKQALKIKHKVTLVPVDTLDDVLKFLADLETKS